MRVSRVLKGFEIKNLNLLCLYYLFCIINNRRIFTTTYITYNTVYSNYLNRISERDIFIFDI